MLGTAVLFLVAHLVMAWLCTRMARDRQLPRILFPYAVIISLFGVLVVGDSQPIFPGGPPYLFGSDGEGYFQDARAIAAGQSLGVLDGQNYIGFQLLLAGLFLVTGPQISVAILANTLILPLTATAVYQATYEATDSRGAGLAATALFVLTPAQAYYAFLLLKDPALVLALAVLALALVRVIRGQKVDWRVLALFAVSIVIIATMRASLLPIVALLSALGVALSRQRLLLLPALLPMFAYIGINAGRFTSYSLDFSFFANTIGANQVIADTLASGDVSTSGVVGTLASIYLGLPFWLKVLAFPLPVAIQFVLPFDFWSTAFLDRHVVAFMWSNLGPVWYLFTGVWMLFAIWMLPRTPIALLQWLLGAGAVLYALIAIVYAGAIPRYATPVITLMYPAAGYWMHRATINSVVRRQVARFFALYFLLAWIGTTLYLTFQVIK